jgi:hypothetical protein
VHDQDQPECREAEAEQTRIARRSLSPLMHGRSHRRELREPERGQAELFGARDHGKRGHNVEHERGLEGARTFTAAGPSCLNEAHRHVQREQQEENATHHRQGRR